MHVLVNESDVINGITAINDLYDDVLRAIPVIQTAMSVNVTTPLLLQLYCGKAGVVLDLPWLLRAATYVSLRYRRPIPKALVLRDSEFFSMVLILKLTQKES